MNPENAGRASQLRLIVPLGVVVLAIVVLFVIATSLGGSDSDDGDGGRGGQNRASKQKKTTEKTYTVEPGDTLTTISSKTGVSVEKLTQLNPKIDPQALVSGDELRLR